jgi:hypothetical protein
MDIGDQIRIISIFSSLKYLWKNSEICKNVKLSESKFGFQ